MKTSAKFQEHKEIHAKTPIGGAEHSLCGLAFDAFESGDADEIIMFAEAGEPVTCKHCRNVIDACKLYHKYITPKTA